MNVRAFRAEMPLDDRIIVVSNGTIRGHWTPGTEGIDPDTLAQAMGLIDHLREVAAEPKRPEFRPVPKPTKRK